MAEGLIFRPVDGRLVVIAGLSTGHLVQLILTSDGLQLVGQKSPYWHHWRLETRERNIDNCRPTPLFHIEEVKSVREMGQQVTVLASHPGEAPWVYELPVDVNNSSPFEGLGFLQGQAIVPRARSLAAMVSKASQIISEAFYPPTPGNLDSCWHVSGDLVCSVLVKGLHTELRLIDLKTGESLARKSLKHLDFDWSYRVMLCDSSTDPSPGQGRASGLTLAVWPGLRRASKLIDCREESPASIILWHVVISAGGMFSRASGVEASSTDHKSVTEEWCEEVSVIDKIDTKNFTVLDLAVTGDSLLAQVFDWISLAGDCLVFDLSSGGQKRRPVASIEGRLLTSNY